MKPTTKHNQTIEQMYVTPLQQELDSNEDQWESLDCTETQDDYYMEAEEELCFY